VQALESWRAAGITHVRAAPPAAELPPLAAPPVEPAATAIVAASAPPPLPVATDADRNGALCALAARVKQCQRCDELARTRTQTVFGVGNPHARVMFIGEAPGADEDKQGEPFVGRAGQLLTKIIAACGWKREDVYICNVLRCRPPGNRTPLPTEADNCREYLDGQISIVQPEYIVCWGSCAAQNLLKTTDSIGRMRQRWFTYGNARVLCTYHPSYLLRNPAAKRPVWDDMLMLLDAMGLKPQSAG
jgi:DNA polymerase